MYNLYIYTYTNHSYTHIHKYTPGHMLIYSLYKILHTKNTATYIL